MSRFRSGVVVVALAACIGCGSGHQSAGNQTDGGGPKDGGPKDSGGGGDAGGGGPTDAQTHTFPTIAGPPGELAAALTSAPTVADAIPVTQQILAKVDVSVVDPVTGEMVSAGPMGEGGSVVWPIHVVNLAAEGRLRATAATMTLDEVADMLLDLEDTVLPAGQSGYPREADTEVGAELVTFLAAWIEEAMAAPDDPESFAPLFLAAMGQRQSPPVDLASGAESPTDIRLTLLDLEVLFSALRTPPPALATGALIRKLAIRLPESIRPVSCDTYSDYVTGTGTVANSTKAARKGAAKALGKAFGKAVSDQQKSFEDFQRNFQQLLTLSHRVMRLVEFYRQGQMNVTVVGPTEVHKVLKGETPRQSTFRASIGFDEVTYNIWSQAWMKLTELLAKCSGTYGLAPPPKLDDLLAKLQASSVLWKLKVKGSEHVAGDYDAAVALRREGAELVSNWTLELTPEEVPKHEGFIADADLSVSAQLEPTAETAAAIDAFIADVAAFQASASEGVRRSTNAQLAEFWKRYNPPQAVATQHLTFHQPGWQGYVQLTLREIKRPRRSSYSKGCGEIPASITASALKRLRASVDVDAWTAGKSGGFLDWKGVRQCQFATDSRWDVHDIGEGCVRTEDSDNVGSSRISFNEPAVPIDSETADLLSPDARLSLSVPMIPDNVPNLPPVIEAMRNTYTVDAYFNSPCAHAKGTQTDTDGSGPPRVKTLDGVEGLPSSVGFPQIIHMLETKGLVSGFEVKDDKASFGGFTDVPIQWVLRWRFEQD